MLWNFLVCLSLFSHKRSTRGNHLKLESVWKQLENQYARLSEVDILILSFYLTQ